LPPTSVMCGNSEIGNIVLVGFMGAGKSTVGRALAAEVALRLVDTDELIVQKRGRPIPRIFDEEGEEAFRCYETEVLRSLADACGLVVATGGGIVGRPENWDLMRRMGPIVYLRAQWPTLRARIGACTNRPLASGDRSEEEIVALLQRRLPLYEQADLIVDTENKTVAEVIEEIRRGIENGC
jgi:shikimate kinase